MEGIGLQFGGPAFVRKNHGMEQEVLQSIARLSNFNVLIQSRHLSSGGVDCRGYCKECKEHVALNFEEVTRNVLESKTWVTLGIFCDKHRHDGTEVVVTVGRKLRLEE